MYAFFEKFVGARGAVALTGFVYAVMILLVLYSALYPQAELKYTAL